jgi:hypothetical protein
MCRQSHIDLGTIEYESGVNLATKRTISPNTCTYRFGIEIRFSDDDWNARGPGRSKYTALEMKSHTDVQ